VRLCRRPHDRFCARPVATLLLVVAGLLAAAAPAAAAGPTYIRVAQLSEGMPGTEVVVASVSDPQRRLTIPGVGYGRLSSYQSIDPGEYVVTLQMAGSTQPPLVSASFTAAEGSGYTLAVGAGEDRGLRIIADDLTPPVAGQAKARVIHAAGSVPVLDIRGPGGEAVALGLPRGQASNFRSVPPGRTTLIVGSPGGSVANLPVEVGVNQIATIVLVERNGTIAAEVNIDAEGPAAVPPGEMNAGFGGAADGPAGVVAFAVVATVAAGVAAYLARRSARDVRRPQW
jgi:hypothetical protein